MAHHLTACITHDALARVLGNLGPVILFDWKKEPAVA